MDACRRALFALMASTALAVPTLAHAADKDAPRVIHAPITEAAPGMALTISATITDQSELFEPTLYYRAAGTKKFQSVSMTGAGNVWSATIPADAVKGPIEYFIEVYDALGNGPARFASDQSPQKVAPKAVAVAPPPVIEKPKPTQTPTRPPDEDRFTAKRPEIRGGGVKQQSSPGKAMKIAGWSTLGLGVLGLGYGTYSGLQMNDYVDKAKQTPSASSAQDFEKKAGSAATRANVSLIAGGVLAAGGATLLLLSGSGGGSAAHDADTDRLEGHLFIGPSGAAYAFEW